MDNTGYDAVRCEKPLFPVFGKSRFTAALSALLFALLAVLAYLLIQTLAAVVFSSAMTVSSGTLDAEVLTKRTLGSVSLISAVANAATVALAVLYLYARQIKIKKGLGLYLPPPASIIPCIILGVALNFFSDSAISLIPFPESFYEQYNAIYSYLGAGNPVIEAISIVVAAPIAEELVFRRFAYGAMREKMPKIVAALISSLMFAVAHGNLLSLFFTFVLGMLLSVSYEVSGSIVVPIIIHASFNASSYLVSYVLDQTGGRYYIVICAASLAVCAAAAFLAARSFINKKKEEKQSADSDES